MTTLLSDLDRNALGSTVYPPLDAARRAARLVRVKLSKATPIRKGAYSDIHLGELADGKDAGRAVALKLMRLVQPDNPESISGDLAAAFEIKTAHNLAGGNADGQAPTSDTDPVTVAFNPSGRVGEQAEGSIGDNILLWKEARIMQSLDHKNIVKFLGLFEDAGNVYIVMPWIGPYSNNVWHSLSLLKYTRTFVAANRYQLMFDVASAIAYLHTMQDSDGAQLVHGDLHEGNVLIDIVIDKHNDRIRAKVCDFGLCKVIPAGQLASNSLASGRNGVILAPELHLADPSEAHPALRTAATDVYAYGVLIYTAYNNGPPFAGQTPTQVALEMCMKQRRPSRPVRIAGGQPLTDGVWGLAQACWQQDPSLRPTMATVLERLRQSAPPGVVTLE